MEGCSKRNTLTALVDETPRDDLPALAAELASAQARTLARIAAPASSAVEKQPDTDDRLLTVNEAAKRLGVDVSWMYRNAKQLPFTRKLGRRTLRFDPKGLDRWAKTRAA